MFAFEITRPAANLYCSFQKTDRHTVTDIAVEIGLDKLDVEDILKSKKLAVDVRNDEYEASRLVIQAIPFFLINVYVHEEGKKYIQNTIWNLSASCGKNITIEATNYIKNNDLIKLEANSKIILRAIHVAGHTLDGVVFYSENEKSAFVGDNIFYGAIGRSDFYGGDSVTLITGIIYKILTMPEDTVLYPGHGQQTTVRHEKNTNPYFNMSGK